MAVAAVTAAVASVAMAMAAKAVTAGTAATEAPDACGTAVAAACFVVRLAPLLSQRPDRPAGLHDRPAGGDDADGNDNGFHADLFGGCPRSSSSSRSNPHQRAQ
jgi:hypothetical protein